jgi:toxin ParE1/3/4
MPTGQEHPMNRYVISPQAEADLKVIWDHIGIVQECPDAANRQLLRFQHKFALLASQPLLGQLREDLRPGLRVFAADSYAILYYPLSDGIEVVGVVHAARHIECLFQNKPR